MSIEIRDGKYYDKNSILLKFDNIKTSFNYK